MTAAPRAAWLLSLLLAAAAVTGVAGLAVEHRHALHVSQLPPHHRDPFDSLLVAQAQLEKLTLVTADEKLAAYDWIDLLQV